MATKLLQRGMELWHINTVRWQTHCAVTFLTVCTKSECSLPTEQLLCQQFNVSRQTVRQALSLLASEGLIERRQGSGSHILPAPRSSNTPLSNGGGGHHFISNYIFPSILREFETVLSANNSAPPPFMPRRTRSPTSAESLQALLEEKPPDGILVEGTKTGLPNPNLDPLPQTD